MIDILYLLFIIPIVGIILLIFAIIHYFNVCRKFIKKNKLEEYTDNEEWLN